MNEPTPQDWRTLYTAAMSEGESGQSESRTEDVELAIQRQLNEAVANFSAFEEAELYAALGMLRRVRVQLLKAA